MYRLETFGTLGLLGPAGRIDVADQRQQRRRLALLAVLAAAGDRGRSRDQLLLLFWPDSTQQRARHSLDQLLYAIRNAFDESVFAGVDPVRLNPGVISSDVADFERALAEGRLAAAVAAYRGAFLDGFYLNDSPEFEHWAEAERARLADRLSEALERLAEAAERQGDHAAAVRSRQRLVEIDPLSSRHALGLIRALSNVGDDAAALRYAESYQRLAAKELGGHASSAITSFVAELHARAAAHAMTTAEKPPNGSRANTLAEDPLASSSAAPELDTPSAARGPVDGRGGRLRARATSFTAVVAAVGLLSAGLYAARQRDTPPASTTQPSVAVLPLTNLGSDSGDVALAGGLTDELTTMLSKLRPLRVVASASVFGLSRPLDIKRVGDSLRVSNVLRGTLQKSGSRIRVYMQLIDAHDGATRWGETYDGELTDVFAVEDEIAQAVTRELNVRLLASNQSATQRLRHRTRNIPAYELYLRGRDPVLLRDDSTARLGLEYFKQAIALDSTFAPAYAGLAHMYARLALGKPINTTIGELHQRAYEAALMAIRLDDSLAEAHLELGLVDLIRQRDLANGERELRRALELDPSVPRAHEYLAVTYIFRGRPADALLEARRNVEVDPMSAIGRAELARELYMNRRYDAALAELDSIASVRPAPLRNAVTRALCYLDKGMVPQALTILRPEDVDSRVISRGALGYVLARAGRRDEAIRVRASLADEWKRSRAGAAWVGITSLGLGATDDAYLWIGRAAADHALPLEIMGPTFESFRRDPRFDRAIAPLRLETVAQPDLQLKR
jgi:TolB-like protein/DNA-binding SARP family transcriptional activator